MPFLFFFLLTVWSCVLWSQQDCKPSFTEVHCNHQKNTVLDSYQPLLSWALKSSCIQQSQSAYRIIISENKEQILKGKGDVWDSSVQKSDKQHCRPSLSLRSARKYFWAVKIWTNDLVESDWSSAQVMNTALLKKEDIKATWIGKNRSLDSCSNALKEAVHYFYYRFELKDKAIRSSYAFVSGLGVFDFYLNGQLVSDQRLNPTVSDYRQRAYYSCLNIDKNLSQGQNALAVAVGNGKHNLNRMAYEKYGLPRLWCQLIINYKDGTTDTILSNENWKMHTNGPVFFNNEYDGEHYDSRKEFSNWATNNMSLADWSGVDQIDDYQPKLSAQCLEPIRVIDAVQAKNIFKKPDGRYIVDFGANIAGWVKIKTKGTQEDKIKLRYSELLDNTLELDTASLRSAKATDVYILKDSSTGFYEPRFTFHGFRYCEITGYRGPLSYRDIQAQFAHNDLSQIGYFNSSDSMLNTLYNTVVRTVRGAYHHVPLDCPQRDERFGWMGDRQATIAGEAYLYNVYAFYKKWMTDISDAQLPSGALPNLAPAFWKEYKDNVTWPSTYIHLAALMFERYKDTLILEQHYHHMHEWLAYLQRNYMRDGLVQVDQYSDWFVPPQSPDDKKNTDPRLMSSSEVIANTALLSCFKKMSLMGSILGNERLQKHYTRAAFELNKQIKSKLLKIPLLSQFHHSPSELLMFLDALDLSKSQIKRLEQHLKKSMLGQYRTKISSGVVGLRFLMKTLSEHKLLDLAYNIATDSTYPSWSFMLKNGATTIQESWTGNRHESQNHLLLTGDLLHWLYGYLGGVRYNSFGEIILKPFIPRGLKQLAVTHKTLLGTIKSRWKKHNNQLHWHIDIPFGARVKVFAPGQILRIVPEQGNEKPKTNKGSITLTSGTYEIICKREKKAIRTPLSAPFFNIQDQSVNVRKDTLQPILIHTDQTQANIRYTTNGTQPSFFSKKYTHPILLQKNQPLKARTFDKKLPASFTKTLIVDQFDSTTNGWNYKYYHIRTDSLPDFKKINAVDSGQITLFDFKKIQKRKHYWASTFEAFIRIPRSGIYTFYLSSDDGSRLLINNASVVENDGVHYNLLKSGSIKLKHGIYPIKIEHFNLWSFNHLALYLSGPKIPKQSIPLSWVFYKKP